MLITRYSSIKPFEIRLNGSKVLGTDPSEPAEFLKTAYRQLHIQYPKFFKMDNLCKLAFLSAEVLLKDLSLTARYPSEETGMIILNSSSSLETDEKHQESINDRANYFPSPSVFVYTLPNIMTGEMAIRHKIKGENAVFISEKPSPGLIYELVSELFFSLRISACITGWIEACHDKFSSCIFLVEKEEFTKSYAEHLEMIIFEPSNLERIFKEELQDGTY